MSGKQASGVMIGLEIHVPLPTRTKLFCECAVDREAPPNTHVCPTCVGFPGSKPYLNGKALEEALKIAMALNCDLESRIFFARKTYFYPDLPKNYQITQHESAIGWNGTLTLLSSGKPIRVRRVHLEEDPASMKHLADGRTLIDHNRSGTPLVEVVTEPDFTLVDEVVEFLDTFFAVLKYLGHPQPETLVRCDLNVSLRGGARVEIKNVSGIKSARKSLIHEVKKQQKLVKFGKKVKRVTLMYDARRNVTVPLRSKEYEEDYGYVFEPDLLQYHVDRICQQVTLPRLPHHVFEQFVIQHGIERETERDLVKNIVFAGPSWGYLLERIAKNHPPQLRMLHFLEKMAQACPDGVAQSLLERYWLEFQDILGHLLDGTVPTTVLEEATVQLAKDGTRPSFESVRSDDQEQLQLVTRLVSEYFDAHPEHRDEIRRNPKFVHYVVGQIVRQTGRKELAKLLQEYLTREETRSNDSS